MRAQLKTAEATIHKLKEEAAKTKALVAQTRSACANEVRKRDRQNDGLKKAVAEAGRARGATKNPGITTVHITGEIGGNSDHGTPRGSTASEEYDLRMETNSFLAELAKGLSQENETLLSLLRRTNVGLKEMSGFDKDAGPSTASSNHAMAMPANIDEMATEIDSVLDHLRTILTNPSFVPIEEVEMREEEISRLRDGWEKMETRWKEAVHLIDGWRRRMQIEGRPVNMEELKMGLRLSPVRVKDVPETSQSLGLRLSAVEEEVEEEASVAHSPSPAESLRLVPAPEHVDHPDVSDSESSIFEDDVDVDDLDVEEPNVRVLQQSTMLESSPLPEPPQLSPLRDAYASGNRGAKPVQPKRQRPGDFTVIAEENTWEMAAAEAPQPPPHRVNPRSAKTQHAAPRLVEREETPQATVELSASSSSLDSVLLVKPATDNSSSSSSKTAVDSAGKTQRPAAKPRHGRTDSTSAPKQPAKPAGRPASRPTSTRNKQAETEKPARATVAASSSTASSSSDSSAASSTATITNVSEAKSTDSAPNMAPPSAAGSGSASPRRGNSRLPLPRTTANSMMPPPPLPAPSAAAAPPQSPLTMATIAAKLAASERDADAARVRAKLRAARLGSQARASLAPAAAMLRPTDGRSTRSDEGAGAADNQPDRDSDPVKKQAATVQSDTAEEGDVPAEADAATAEKPRKRERRVSKVASRRRSTLNPWELESLIQGSVAVATPGRG
jgi:hypothetical protein